MDDVDLTGTQPGVGQEGVLAPLGGNTSVPEPVNTPPVVPPVPTPPVARDWQKELDDADKRIRALMSDRDKLVNAGQMTDAKMTELRGDIQKEADAKVALEQARIVEREGYESKVAELSQATQTTAAEVEQLRAENVKQQAELTKFRILNTEFADLIGWSEMIAPSADEGDVRKACQRVRDLRAQDIESQRTLLGVAAPGAPTNAPRLPDSLTDPAHIDAYLKEGARMGPEEFAKRKSEVIGRVQAQQNANPRP